MSSAPAESKGTQTGPLLSGRFGKYEIERLLGRGGMGAVYLARQIDLERPVVIKVIAPDVAAEPGTVERLQREAKTAARISSENVVQVYDTGVEQGIAYIAMEYVEGNSAADLLKARGKLPWAEAIQIVVGAAKGLGAAHAKNVLHRDVKPANILVAKDGKVKVADFGIAKSTVTGPEGAKGSVTRSGIIVGSPQYMSPEQADAEPVDARTDIYSLGVTFYELLTGKLPFQAESVIKTLSLVLSGSFSSPQKHVPDLPVVIEKACLKLMAREKGARPATAKDALELLEKALDVAAPKPVAPKTADVATMNIEIEGLDGPDHVAKLRDRLGQDLPDYEIIEELGRGGVGVVFKARHAPTDEVVALKILMMAELASPKTRARFEEEAEITRRLNHPGIVPVRTVGTTASGLPFFTMKFVDGDDLATILRQPSFTREKGLAILKEVALAVQTAHAMGVVHRDLKPENIKIEKSSGRPFVLDFGLAKSTDAKEKNLTVTGALLGTPYYMSYEQALGRHRDVDSRTDVYALGAMLYVILTGKPPFDADSAGELFAKIIKEEPRRPRAVKSDVPPSLEKVALKALKKNKDERQPDAGTFAKELDAAIAAKDAPDPSEEESVFSDKAPSSGGGTASYNPKSSHDDDSQFADEIGGPGGPKAPAAPPKPAAPAPAPASPPAAAPGPRAGTATTRTSSGAHRVSERVRAGEGTGSRPRASSSSPDLVLDPARASRMRSMSSGSMPALATPSERVRKAAPPEPAFEAVAPGAVLAEWTVRESLGEEEGVRVFEVEKNGRKAVLREHPLPPQAADDLVAFAERLAPVRNDDLEPILGSGRSRAGAWYVVDDRPTVRARVGEKGAHPEKDALAIIRSVARALASLGQRNLSHGDPSPRNIVVDSKGNARLASPVRVRNAVAILGTGPITGDARYAAPGVLDGQAPLAADDVFTLGLTFAYLLAGKDPVPEAEPTAAMMARARLPGTVPELKSLAPEASEGACALYARMTERDPARRPQPSELAAEVEALVTQGKIPAPAPRRKPTALPRPILPVPVALVLAIVAVAAAVVAVGVTLTTTSEDPAASYKIVVPTDGK